MVEQRSPKPSVACSSRVSPAKKHISPSAVCVFLFKIKFFVIIYVILFNSVL